MATLKFSVAVRTARVGAIEGAVGTAPKLQFWSGTMPTNCAAADAGDGAKLAEEDCPSDWLDAAAAGAVAKLGTWSCAGLAAASTGTAITHFRLKDTAGTTCHIQGDVTVTGGGGAMTVDNTSIATDQVITVTGFTLTDANS